MTFVKAPSYVNATFLCRVAKKKTRLIQWDHNSIIWVWCWPIKAPSYVNATFFCRFAKIVQTPSKKLLFVSKTFVKAPSYVNATFLCRVVKKNRLITMRPQPNYLTLVLTQLILLNFDQKIGLSKHYYMSTQNFFVALPK